MIKYSRFTLSNGLRVLVHEDRSTPLVAMNILYDVGSKDEDKDCTGLAHLFEHLMFGGSVNIPDYDTPLQLAGGENNAFTNNDITNYYLTVPANNIETGFWLESDRMLALDFSQKNLDTQKSVVTEEFNQRYINQPYGDAILRLRPMAFKKHPYRWPAIGADISHIQNVDLDRVKDFFYSHYAPNNAILTLAGNIDHDTALLLSEKWFGPIEKRQIAMRQLPDEDKQTEARRETSTSKVPASAIYKVYHIGKRLDNDFYTLDLITDLLAGGESGRLHTQLVREKKLFSEINAYLTSDVEPGLLFLHGKLMQNVGVEIAETAMEEVLKSLTIREGADEEFEKVKNKFESSAVFSNTSILNKAANLAYYELLGDADMINHETELYRNISFDMVTKAHEKYLQQSNCSTLIYLANK